MWLSLRGNANVMVFGWLNADHCESIDSTMAHLERGRSPFGISAADSDLKVRHQYSQTEFIHYLNLASYGFQFLGYPFKVSGLPPGKVER